MNNLKVGTIYVASAHKEGQNRSGRWESLTVRDERGKNPITVFVENIPSNVEENGAFRIERILDVSFGRRQMGEDFVSVSNIHAVVSPVVCMAEKPGAPV